jgi:AcrR family transcriptional regulator
MQKRAAVGLPRVASRKAGKTHAQARERSRRAILRAGAEMLTDSAQRNPFAAIRIRQLCERAEYSTGAFYAHWPNAKAFYDELSEYFMGEMLIEDFDALIRIARRVAKKPGAAAIVNLAEEDLRILLANEQWDAVELLNLTIARTTHGESARRGYRAVDEVTAETYALILERLGREPRPPVTASQIGVALQALVEGFALRSRVEPEAMSPSELQHQTLYAYAVAGLLSALTRPRGDERDVLERLEDELRSAD